MSIVRGMSCVAAVAIALVWAGAVETSAAEPGGKSSSQDVWPEGFRRIFPPERMSGVKIHVRDLREAATYYQKVFQMFVAAQAGDKVKELIMAFERGVPVYGQPNGSAPEPFLVLVFDPTFKNESTIPAVVMRSYDIDGLKKRAADAGYPVGGDGGHFVDPSGNIVEVTINRYLIDPRKP